MVSFWPWRSDPSSTASFEKTLSVLSAKITDTQTRLDQRRTSARRVKVLLTLYLSFAYLVCLIVLLLVVGYKNLGVLEWTGLASGPLVIYSVRALTNAFYSYRIDGLETSLKGKQSERAKTIQKLKDMTKYDSTLELIEKYGGSEGAARAKKADSSGVDDAKMQKKSAQRTPSKEARSYTKMPPPPTANIQRRYPTSELPGGPTPSQDFGSHSSPTRSLDPSAEFAPNAYAPDDAPFPDSQQLARPLARPEPHWYDRVFDVLLGEDETSPQNRIALICRSCRLVNGLAPPGTKSLAGLGVWRCMACHAVNGEIDEGRKIVREVLHGRQAGSGGVEDGGADGSEGNDTNFAVDQAVNDDQDKTSSAGSIEAEAEAEADSPPAQVRTTSGRSDG